MTRKPLAENFTKGEIRYTLLARECDVAIYHRSNGRWNDYEVIRVQSHDGFIIDGNVIPPAETYPSTNSWGVSGWTFATETAAREKFASLLEKAAATVP